jgi:hypothetical protein
MFIIPIYPNLGGFVWLCHTYIRVSRQCSEPQKPTDNKQKQTLKKRKFTTLTN